MSPFLSTTPWGMQEHRVHAQLLCQAARNLMAVEWAPEPLVPTRDLNDCSVSHPQRLELIDKLERSGTPTDPNRVMRLYQFSKELSTPFARREFDVAGWEVWIDLYDQRSLQAERVFQSLLGFHTFAGGRLDFNLYDARFDSLPQQTPNPCREMPKRSPI